MMKKELAYDLIILGGGPAGMTAAIYAAKANLKTIILESNITGGLVNSTWIVENYPSVPSIHGMDLMQNMRKHVDSLDVAVEEVCEVERLDLAGTRKAVETDDVIYSAPAIILCTGRNPIPLGVDTECDQVHYCAICDGGAYKAKKIIVVGGGNSGFDESLYLLNLGIENITIVEVMDRYFAAQSSQDALFGTGKVEGLKSTTVVDLNIEDGKLKSAVLENVETKEQQSVEADGIFVFLGQNPNNELFKGAVTLDENGYIITGKDMSTNIPGVYGAGDINQKMFRQITTAMSDGTIAALSAERHIRKQAK